MSVNGPELQTGTVVVLDGNNIALTRTGMGRAVVEDILGCVEYCSARRVSALTFLDGDDTGRLVHRVLTGMHGLPNVWVCKAADPVILEVAALLDKSIIVSRDDFAEFQRRHALVLFSPSRLLAFSPSAGPGHGSLVPRQVRAKDPYLQSREDDFLQDATVIIDALLSAGHADGARRALEKARVIRFSGDQGVPGVVAEFIKILLDACSRKFPRWYQGHSLSLWSLRTALRQTPKEVRAELRGMPTGLDNLLRHLDTHGQFPNARARRLLGAVLKEFDLITSD